MSCIWWQQTTMWIKPPQSVVNAPINLSMYSHTTHLGHIHGALGEFDIPFCQIPYGGALHMFCPYHRDQIA